MSTLYLQPLVGGMRALGANAGDGRLILEGTVKTYRYIDEEEAAEREAAEAGAP